MLQQEYVTQKVVQLENNLNEMDRYLRNTDMTWLNFGARVRFNHVQECTREIKDALTRIAFNPADPNGCVRVVGDPINATNLSSAESNSTCFSMLDLGL